MAAVSASQHIPISIGGRNADNLTDVGFTSVLVVRNIGNPKASRFIPT
jgi:hypothetical protein